ncbi:MAG: ABC transporter permease subunit [Steroidobacteraceae bacterium]|nr:ABC transporter permease subunit [Nevskiaceae bacterium]MCP5339702.1 ABC transporter permease subunit [Nevskiaceae bacterium]MCP5360621.1 ABC transporter permease subunit [Nevskiaceae bacterium]MCP5467235.1 ABC transporter permease subunit [Nevskiaceae bacterium]
MLRFLATRIAVLLPTLLIIVTLSFFLMRVAPGGPFDADAQLEPEILENLRAVYDLDKPVIEQFGLYLQRLARGDLGPSITYKDYDVSELIAVGLPVSLQLGLMALLLATLIGLPLGIIAAANQNRGLDHLISTLAMAGIAVPSLITAPLLTLVFGVMLKLLPVAGWGDGAWENKILPLTALVLPQLAVIARLSRGSFLDVRRQNFIRAARARGLPEWRVVLFHALPPTLVPLVSYLAPAVAGVMTGSIVIEQIFGLPGVGRYFIQGALSRDYPLVMGVVIVYATAVLTMNLLADLAYAALDPRIRRGMVARGTK